MKLLILGIGSAVPTTNRNPTAQILEVDNSLYLIDCGEGTQIKLRKNKVRIQRIKAIFISHMHGDHYLGLMGLLWTMNLLGRKDNLTICGPSELFNLITLHQNISGGNFNFEITKVEVDKLKDELPYQDKKITVKSIPLDHKIFCSGYLFTEKDKLKKLVASELEKYQIPIAQSKGIKEGKDYFNEESNEWISNDLLTIKPPVARKYAFCSDTRYNEEIIDYIQGVNLLYHEATFLEKDKNMAKKRMHSIAAEAAKIAKLSKVDQLLLGHYSNRYQQLGQFKVEALAFFPNVLLGEEDKWYQV